MRTSVITLLGLALLLPFLFQSTMAVEADFISLPMFSELSAAEKDLLEEYRRNYELLKQHYDNAFITAKAERRYFPVVENQQIPPQENQEPNLTFSASYEYRGNGGNYYRLNASEWMFHDPKDKNPKPQIWLGIVAKDKSFLLIKKKEQARYYFLRAKRNTDDPNNNMSIHDYMFPFLAFSETGMLLEYVLFQKPRYASECKVRSVKSTLSEQGEIITVLMTAITEEEGKPVNYRFEFLRDHYWGIKSLVMETETWRHITQNEYLFTEGAIPELKRSVIEAEPVDKSPLNIDTGIKFKRAYRRTYDITQCQFGPVDLSEFDVAQFLPPTVKIGEVTPAGLSVWRIASILAGIAFVLFGLYLKFLSG